MVTDMRRPARILRVSIASCMFGAVASMIALMLLSTLHGRPPVPQADGTTAYAEPWMNIARSVAEWAAIGFVSTGIALVIAKLVLVDARVAQTLSAETGDRNL